VGPRGLRLRPGERHPATAQAPAGETTLAAEATGLAALIADSWRGRQEPGGAFTDDVRRADPLPWRDTYGSVMLGAGLLFHGTRTGQPWAVRAGLRAVEDALRGPLKRDQRQVFQTLAFGTVYDLGMRRLRTDPGFRRLRPLLERRLRGLSFQAIGGGRAYYNYYLVEAAGVLAITRHPLRSRTRGALLRDPAASRRTVRRMLSYQLPRYALSGTTEYDAVRLTLISDPPSNPPAYHAFSTALLGRSIALLGDRGITTATRKLLERAGRASWALMSPTGDVSWFGRSQEQSWTLATTASGLAAASDLRRVSAETKARLRSTALRALQRLRAAYLSARYGLAITPSVRDGVTRQAILGLDRYVAMASYTGLTLLGLEWLLDSPSATVPFTPVRIGADRDRAFRLARDHEFTTVRHGDVWYAVAREPEDEPKAGSDHSHDLRYDAGLNRMEVRVPGGTWESVFPPRPFTDVRTDVDTAGPTLAVARGPAVRPEGTRPLQVEPVRGEVTLTVKLARHDGRVLATGIPYRYRPVGCGVRLEVPSTPGRDWWYSVFFRGSPRRDGDAVTDGHQRVSVDAPFKEQQLASSYSSGMDARLTRVRLTITPAREAFSVTFCREGVPQSAG
jgi:hypothetical protein